MRMKYKNRLVERDAIREGIHAILTISFFLDILKNFGNRRKLGSLITQYGTITGFNSSLERIVIRLDRNERKIVIVFSADFQNGDLVFTIEEISGETL